MPSSTHIRKLLALAVFVCCSGCGFVHDEVLDGPYRLVAVDTRGDMSLCISVGDDCSGDGLPGPMVFAAGANRQFVDIARHPPAADGQIDRRVTEYYYIIRMPDEAKGVDPKNLIGPLDQARFDQEKRRLGLPAFSRVFDDLK
jgi:hypothetical protein